MFSLTMSSGAILSTLLAKQQRSGEDTSSLFVQFSKCSMLSIWSVQYKQKGVGTLPSLASRSLVGKRDWSILNKNDFCSGAKPNSLDNL